MKNVTLAPAVLFAIFAFFAVAVVGQTKTGVASTNQAASTSAGTAGHSIRSRGTVPKRVAPAEERIALTTQPELYSETNLPSPSLAPVFSPRNESNEGASSRSNAAAESRTVTRRLDIPITAALTRVYRIGVGDVLDIQLPDNTTRESTLFTVLSNGLLDFPLAGEPVQVSGLTTDEVASLLRQRIKLFERPAVSVNVRDFASHTVTINGFVAAPGSKFLRREAVPLFVLLSEALPVAEAKRATIIRNGDSPLTIDLADANASSTLVVSGDVIKVWAAPFETEFFFIGGAIKLPGQKPYHSGLTLTQAILASGGLTKDAGDTIRLLRQGADGCLVTTQYNLASVMEGKVPDPAVENGDRVELSSIR